MRDHGSSGDFAGSVLAPPPPALTAAVKSLVGLELLEPLPERRAKTTFTSWPGKGSCIQSVHAEHPTGEH